MGNKVGLHPRRISSLALWAGSDHYSLKEVWSRAPFFLPVDRVTRVYEVRAKSLFGLGKSVYYAIEYSSESRDCFITLENLPKELEKRERAKIKPPGAALLLMRHCWREPTAMLLPLVIPLFLAAMILGLGLWNEIVLHNETILQFFARPGCDTECVRKVLSIHSLVVFLFLAQLSLMFLPVLLLLFQAPRYRSALNYRMIQSYSICTVVVGIVIFAQLLSFFPFRSYGRFVEMGFDPKVERLLSNLDKKK